MRVSGMSWMTVDVYGMACNALLEWLAGELKQMETVCSNS
jgi:hypothetical protein